MITVTVLWLIIALLVITPILFKIFAPLAKFFALGILLVIALFMFNDFADWWSDVGTWIVLGGFGILIIIGTCIDLVNKYKH